MEWCEDGRLRSGLRVAALALVLGCAYYVAAVLGLAQRSEPEGVVVLWPASGVAVGVLMALGRRARPGVALGAFGATVAAHLTAETSPWAAVWFGLCNTAEVVLAAWLVQRWSGPRFEFDSLRELWGFLAAAAVAPAAAGIGAVLAMRQIHAATLFVLWCDWAAANGLGIVTVAPLVVGLYRLEIDRTPAHEMLEGLAALTLLAVSSVAVYTASPGSPWAQVPPAVLFPLILWVAARCRPLFAAAAAFIISGALAGSATFHLGPFARPDMTALTVQATVLVASLCALTLAVLFAERRRSETALLESNERLQLALVGAQLGVWCVDLATGDFESDARDSQINGHDPARPPRTLAEARKFLHPADLPMLDKAFSSARRTGAPCQVEYRVRVGGGAGEIRWVAVEGNVVRDAAGRAVRLLGVTRDITERKLAESQKDLLLAELDHRVKNALAVVAAVTSRTQETSASLPEFVAALDGRIKSMATTHELLSGRKWQGIRLAELIQRELEPYANGSNVSIDGPEAVLCAEAGQAMAMVVHELVTNAAKYGALSVERGRVSVRWAHEGGNGAGSGLVLEWVERGGPAVPAGARPGYGTSVIRDLLPYELGGSVDLQLVPAGVRCRFQIPAKWLSGPGRPQRAARQHAAAPMVADGRS